MIMAMESKSPMDKISRFAEVIRDLLKIANGITPLGLVAFALFVVLVAICFHGGKQ